MNKQQYWFSVWLKKYRVNNELTLNKALTRKPSLNALLSSAPPPTVSVRKEPSELVELTGGKGIDLTGELSCHHINCLKEEVNGLFRHTWHYFDQITLPDQALYRVLEFQDHKDVSLLRKRLVPFVLVLEMIEKNGGQHLVRFESRTPGCLRHAKEHAREANIDQSFANTSSLITEIAKSAVVSWDEGKQDGHKHLNFQLVHPQFEHTEWESLCSRNAPIPKKETAIRRSIVNSVVQRYLAELCADALAARRTHTPLGSTIPFYKRLLATRPSAEMEAVAFDLGLPISPNISIKKLVKLRQVEGPSFQRFQTALRKAIGEYSKIAPSSSSAVLARQIKRDVIDPELRRIRDLLVATRVQTDKSAAIGVGLGIAAVTAGLLTPLSANPIGSGLVVGGALTTAASSIKKAYDDRFAIQRDVALSDMYFLWRTHRH